MPPSPAPTVGLRAGIALAVTCLLATATAASESSDAAKTAYASAAALQNREAWELAGDEWEALLATHPADPLALKGRYYLAICQLKQDDWPAAERTLRDVIESRADADTLALARLELGRGLFRVAREDKQPEAFTAAATALEAFVAASPGHPQAASAASLAAESRWQAGGRQEAIAAWRRFLKVYPEASQTPDVLYALGVGLAEEKQFAEAAAILARFAAEYGGHAFADDVALWRADVAMALDKPAEVEPIVAPVAAAGGPRAAEALERLANARWTLEQWPAAAEAFAKLAAGKPGPRTSRAALMAGRAFAEAGLDEKARTWLATAAKAGGRNGLDAAHRLARLELDAKRPEAALAVTDQAMAAAGDDPTAEPDALAILALDRADALWALPDRQAEAIAAFLAVAERYPATPSAAPARSMAALASLETGKPAEAAKQAEAFLARHAATASPAALADVRAIRAEALLAQGLAAEAAAAYADLIAANPRAGKKPDWLLRQGAAWAAAGQWQSAHAALAAATSGLTGDRQAEALFLDATALVELDKPAEAARLLATLGTRHPRWGRRHESLLLEVRALDEAGNAEAALAAAERLLREFPAGQNADLAWYRLGQLRQRAGRQESAIAAFRKSIAAKPAGRHAPWAALDIGWCHEAAGRLDEAIMAWTDLIEKHAGTTAMASGLLARADARQRIGDPAGGLADCRRFLDDSRLQQKLDQAAIAEASYIQGLCLAGQEKHAQAAATFRKLLAETPDFPAADRATFELGLALANAGRPDDAATVFGDLVKRFPESTYAADAWLEIGERQWAAEKWPTAAEAYRETIAAAGDSPELASLVEQARHKLGWTHVMRDDDAAAAEAFAAQLQAAPNGPLAPDAAVMLGDALVSLGRMDEASRALNRALADPTAISTDALRDLAFLRAAEAAAARDAWQESLEIATRCLTVRPDSPRGPEARYAAGWALHNLGRLDEAAAAYREAAAGPPTELAARARMMEGEVLFEQKRHKEAIKAFFKAAYGFGDSPPPAFHPWQAQATFEAARCFEVLGQPQQARTLYAELVERYPGCEHAPAARKRLAALDRREPARPAAPGASS